MFASHTDRDEHVGRQADSHWRCADSSVRD